MATPYTNNNGSTFYNINDCRSFNQAVSSNLIQLSAYPCSEIIFINKGTTAISLYDNEYSADVNALVLSAAEVFIMRGVTSASAVSAKTASGAGSLYYRTQYYSFLPQR